MLFEECLARREAEGRLTDLFVRRGFSEVMTPGIEFYDVFHADSMAIPAESMYKLSDDKGRLLVMRPDSTMPIAPVGRCAAAAGAVADPAVLRTGRVPSQSWDDRA